MSKTQLIKAAKITATAMAQMWRNKDVRAAVLVKICIALDCTMDDILDIVPDER